VEVFSIFLIALASAATPTDFGVRDAPGERSASRAQPVASTQVIERKRASGGTFDLDVAVRAAGKWGRVTSTRRSEQRNRAVGGAPNSYHLSGRAIDVARRPGVRHSEVELAFRKAGFDLVESIDEGDHSHFAFRAGSRGLREPKLPEGSWRIVYAPRSTSSHGASAT
jgi:hypothetical protein